MRKKIAFLALGIMLSIPTIVFANSAKIYVSDSIEQNQINTITTDILHSSDVSPVGLKFEEEAAMLELTTTSGLISEDVHSLVYTDLEEPLNLKAVNTDSITASMFANAMITAGVSHGEFLLMNTINTDALNCYADALHAYQDNGDKLDSKKVSLSVEELELCRMLSASLSSQKVTEVISRAKTLASSNDFSGETVRTALNDYSIPDSVILQLVGWCEEYATVYKEYKEYSFGAVNSKSILESIDLDSTTNSISTTYAIETTKADAFFGCFRKKDSKETEFDTVSVIDDSMIPDDAKIESAATIDTESASTERAEGISESSVTKDSAVESETAMTEGATVADTAAAKESESESQASSVEPNIEILDQTNKTEYKTIAIDNSYNGDGLSNEEKKYDNEELAKLKTENDGEIIVDGNSSVVTTSDDYASIYDTDNYKASYDYNDADEKNLLQ